MGRFFYQIYLRIQSNKAITLCIAFALLFSLVYFSLKLKFEEDITKLIPENEKAVTLNKVLDQVDFADKIVVHLKVKEKGDINELTQVASQLVELIEKECGNYITDIQGLVNDDDFEETFEFVYDNLPLFLTPEDYTIIKQNTTTEAIQKRTADNYKTLISPSGFVARSTILKDPFGMSFLGLQKLKELQVGDDFTIKNGFVVSKDGNHLLLFIKPKLASNETNKNTAFVTKLNSIKTKLNSNFKNRISIGYYGATVVAVANANQIKADIQLTVSIALSILFLILILFYKKISIPLILFSPTVFGALLAVTALYFFRGTISAISIGIGSILLGITLDFSLHILTHYRKNSNVKELYADVTKPIVMSSITTALAFLCLLFIKSRALQDLGIFAAVSVFGAAFFALLLIPHLYKPGNIKKKKSNFIDTIANFEFSKNKVLLISCMLLFVISIFTYNNVLFDKDISKMNYQTQELLDEENSLNSLLNTASKSLYIVAHGKTLNEALSENQNVYTSLKSFKEQQKIISFSSVASVVLGEKHQEDKIDNWNRFWSEEKQNFVKEELISSGKLYGFKASTYNHFYDRLSNLQNGFQDILTIEDYQEVKTLNTNEYISGTENFFTVLSSLKVNETNAANIKSFFEENKNVVVIDRQAMNETFLNGFKNNFNTLLGYSFIAVLLVLFFFFKRIELVLITIVPIALTWLVTIGLMGILGLSFNIFNIIISTFIFGLGVDYAIFMTNGLIKEYETGERHLPIYRTSIILSVITTILGVGVLIFAKHPALYSIALICLLGILTALVITFVIQPILFRGAITNRAKKGFAPLEFRKTIHSIISFTFYGLGGMLLSLIAITLLKVLPINKKAKFKWLHGAMAKLATSVLYSNPFVNKSVVLNKETFKKQAVIIANHTSFLDTLAIALVTPKVIFLVNDWVYKSPVFGQLAKVAGYYPVSSGVDGSLDHLKEKMRQGYSLIVFPEGKRMFSNKLGRFHKGAFFLAEELNLDVLPLYIHGNSEVLPKGDFIIYDGAITVNVGDRIAIDDPVLGNSVKEKTKIISKIFKNDFQKFREEVESPTYFKKLVLSNFVYKSEAIYNAVKYDLNKNIELYHVTSKLIDLDAKLLHISDDYGQLDLLLNYYSNTRKITTFIADETKATIASNNFIGKDRTINYVKQLSEVSNINTLLITDAIDISNINLTSVKKIVILNVNIATTSLVEIGFKITEQNNKSIVLTRKI